MKTERKADNGNRATVTTDVGVSDTDLEVIVIETFGKFKNKIENFGSKPEARKINQKAIRELGSKHV